MRWYRRTQVQLMLMNTHITPLKLALTLITASLLSLYLFVTMGAAKPPASFVWVDIIAEAGTWLIAMVWLVMLLRSRPAGPVTMLLAIGLSSFAFSWWVDLLDEFIKIPNEMTWDMWLESLPIPIGFLFISAGIYLWHKEEKAISAQMVKKEKVFRDHRLFDAFVPLGSADYLREQIKLTIKSAQANEEALSLLVIDLNQFTEINHQYGHAEGDQILQAVTQLLLLNLRDKDLLCRLAGDRFVAVLSNTNAQQAEQFASEIRLAIEHFAYRTQQTGERVYLTASTAITESQDTDAQNLLKTLNEKLKQEKRNFAPA